jgi:hypothetical protein
MRSKQVLAHNFNDPGKETGKPSACFFDFLEK